MTTKLSQPQVGLKRCAVCKIDLKARFVFIDDKVEELLGYTKEDLFGKSFLDFIDEPSQELINKLLEKRNRYETYFDSTNINVFNRDKQLFPAKIVVTLNFIGGNPVNFQMIIDPIDDGGAVDFTDKNLATYKTFLEEFTEIDELSDYKKLITVLLSFSGAEHVCLYLIDEEKLNLVTTASHEIMSEFLDPKIIKPTYLHYDVAKTHQDYSFIDDNSIQKVIEKYGTAPDEFVTSVSFDQNHYHLIRFIYPENFDHNSAANSIRKVKTGLKLIEKLSDKEVVQEDSYDSSNDIQFTVGFLDILSIPTFITNNEGEIVGYNPSMLKYFNKDNLVGTYVNPINTINKLNKSSIQRHIIDYVNSTLDDDNPHNLEIDVKLSKAVTCKLTVIKIGDHANDLSACFVFTPQTISGDKQKSTPVTSSPNYVDLFSHLKRTLSKSLKEADEICNRYYNELGEEGNEMLSHFNFQMHLLTDNIAKLKDIYKLINSQAKRKQVDLNLSINKAIRKIKHDYPLVSIDYQIVEMPKIKVRSDILDAILKKILINSIKYNNRPNFTLNIKADVKENICQIDIIYNGSNSGSGSVPNIFECLIRSDVKDKNLSLIELAYIKELVVAINGEVTVEAVERDKTAIEVTIPTK